MKFSFQKNFVSPLIGQTTQRPLFSNSIKMHDKHIKIFLNDYLLLQIYHLVFLLMKICSKPSIQLFWKFEIMIRFGQSERFKSLSHGHEAQHTFLNKYISLTPKMGLFKSQIILNIVIYVLKSILFCLKKIRLQFLLFSFFTIYILLKILLLQTSFERNG